MNKGLFSLFALIFAWGAHAEVERHLPLFMGIQEKAYQAPAAPPSGSFPAPNLLRDIRNQLKTEGRHLYPGAAVVPQQASKISDKVGAPVRESNLIFVAGEPTHYAAQAIDGWTFSLIVKLQNGRTMTIDFDSKSQDLVYLDEAAGKLRMKKSEAVRLGELTRYKLSPVARGYSNIEDVELVLTPFSLVPHKSFSRGQSANDNPPFRVRALPSLVITSVAHVQEFLNVSSSCSFYLNDFLVTGNIF